MLDWLLGESAGDRGEEPRLQSGPQLCLIAVADDFLALHNDGTATARNVRVDVEASSIVVLSRAEPLFDLRPGQSWTFLIGDLGPWTEAGWQLTVTWDGQPEPVCIPLPAGAL